MMLIDANILIYAHVSSFVQHDPARDWLDQQLNASAPVGLPWVRLLGFLRLVTNPRVFEKPEPIAEAWQQVRTLRTTRRYIRQISPCTWRPWQSRTGRSSGGIGGGTWADALFHRRRFCSISGIALD
jgi:toxin-antitoxin system PIN domain toxin